MALSLLSRSYGSTNAGNKVVIRDTTTGSPARLYARTTGGLISRDGSYKLPANGELAVYVDPEPKLVASWVSLTPSASSRCLPASTYSRLLSK